MNNKEEPLVDNPNVQIVHELAPRGSDKVSR